MTSGWRASSATPSRSRFAIRDDEVDPLRLQRSQGLEQKENIFLTAYAAFPLAPIFMIWSFAWGTGWTRWPCASTALSIHIFLDAHALHPYGRERRLPIRRSKNSLASSQLWR
jgi:hypothetical protein